MARGERGDGLVLGDDALVQLGLNAQEFLLLVFLMEVTAMPVQRETTSSMSSRVTMPVEASSSFNVRAGRGIFFLCALSE